MERSERGVFGGRERGTAGPVGVFEPEERPAVGPLLGGMIGGGFYGLVDLVEKGVRCFGPYDTMQIERTGDDGSPK